MFFLCHYFNLQHPDIYAVIFHGLWAYEEIFLHIFNQINISWLIVSFFWMCKFMPTTNCLCKIKTPSSTVPWLSPARWQTLRSTGRSAPERPAGSSLRCSATSPTAPPDAPGHAAYLSPQALVNIKTWTHRCHREDTRRADNQIFSDLWREWASGC